MLIFGPDFIPTDETPYLHGVVNGSGDFLDLLAQGEPNYDADADTGLYIQELEPHREGGFVWVHTDRRGNPVDLFYAVGPSNGPVYVQESEPGVNEPRPWLWLKVAPDGSPMDLVVNTDA